MDNDLATWYWSSLSLSLSLFLSFDFLLFSYLTRLECINRFSPLYPVSLCFRWPVKMMRYGTGPVGSWMIWLEPIKERAVANVNKPRERQAGSPSMIQFDQDGSMEGTPISNAFLYPSHLDKNKKWLDGGRHGRNKQNVFIDECVDSNRRNIDCIGYEAGSWRIIDLDIIVYVNVVCRALSSIAEMSNRISFLSIIKYRERIGFLRRWKSVSICYCWHGNVNSQSFSTCRQPIAM